MHDLIDDTRFAIGNALRKPGINLLMLLTFALGIGANSAVFSVVYHAILAPLPYTDGDRLVRVQQHQPLAENNDIGSSVQSFFDFRRMTEQLSDLVEYHSMQFTLLGHGEPKRVQTGVVSWNYFDMLGIEPSLGRGFDQGEDELGSAPLILLSHRYWVEQFASDPNVVGASLEMNNAVHTVIGVLPPFPAYPNNDDIYITAASCPFRSSEGMINNRGMGMLTLLGKLQPSASIDQGSQELKTISAQLAQQYPDDYPKNRGFTANLVSLKEEMIGNSAQTFYLLLVISTLVVLIASANVANLNIAKLAGRSQEIAVREALGASPSRIAKQLLTESTFFAVLGGMLGLLLAFPMLYLLKDFASDYTPLASEIKMDATVLGFSFLISVLAGLLSGTVSVFNRRNINNALKEGGDKVTASSTGLRWRNGLLITQIALSFVILCVATMVSISLYRLTTQDTGFSADKVLAVNMDLNFSNYTNAQQRRDFAMTVLEGVSALPDVELASVSGSFPLSSNLIGPVPFEAENQPLADNDVRPRATVTIVSEDYHSLLNIPLLQGRYFNQQDDENNTPVIIVNQALVNRLFPQTSPLSQRLSTDNGQSWLTIVGVTGNVRSQGLDISSQDAFYVPFRQRPVGRVRVLAKTNGSPMALRDPIVSIVHQLDLQQAIASSQTLMQVKQQWLSGPTLIANLVSLFGLLALLITVSGVVGVVAYNVSQKKKEIGIRMAIGATPIAIINQLLLQTSLVAFSGLALGLLVIPTVAPIVSSFLYETSSEEVTIYLSTGAILLITSAIATCVPARKATRMNPATTLRDE